MRPTFRKSSLFLLFPVLIVAAFAYLQHRSTVNSREEVDGFIKSNLPHMTVTHGKVQANLFTGMTTVRDVRVDLDSATRKQSLLVSGLSYHKNTDSKGLMERLRVELEGIQLPLDKATMDPATKSFFEKLKVDSLAMNFHLDYHFNPKAHSLELFAKGIANDLADANVTVQLVDVDPAAGPANLMSAKIRFVQLTYHDHSLFDRTVDMLAQKVGKPREQFLKDVEGRIHTEMEQPEVANPFEKFIAPSLVAFLKNPNTLTLSLRPSQPVTLAQLAKVQKPEELENYGLKVQLN